jgi:hypothetical protein
MVDKFEMAEISVLMKAAIRPHQNTYGVVSV